MNKGRESKKQKNKNTNVNAYIDHEYEQREKVTKKQKYERPPWVSNPRPQF